MPTQPDNHTWFGSPVAPGEHASRSLSISESYSSSQVAIPIHVWRGHNPGPTVAITAAVHAVLFEQLDPIDAIAQLMNRPPREEAVG